MNRTAPDLHLIPDATRAGRRLTMMLGLALSVLAGPTSVRAELLNDTTSDGSQVELVFMAWETTTAGTAPRAYFVKDLGLTMTDFFVSGQSDAGVSKGWYLGGTGSTADDATWTSFVNTDFGGGAKMDLNKLRWAVFAYAAGDGSLTPGQTRLFTTNLQGVSGDATKIPGLSTLTGDALQNINSPFPALTSSAKNRGTMASLTDGSAYALQKDGLPNYQWGSSVGGNADASIFSWGDKLTRDAGNTVGKSSWFYNLTPSDPQGFDGTVPATIDEFDNLGNDGYWGFAATTDTSKPGEFFLSYTLKAYTAPAEASSHTLSANNFARLAGILSLSSASGKGGTVLDLTEGFLRGFAAQASAVDVRSISALAGPQALGLADGLSTVSAPVPEVSSSSLMALGLAALGLLARRRRDQAARG